MPEGIVLGVRLLVCAKGRPGKGTYTRYSSKENDDSWFERLSAGASASTA